MTTARLASRRRDESGTAAVELVLMAASLVGFTVLVVAGARLVDADSQVDDASYAAARAASLEQTFDAGRVAGEKAAQASLGARGKACVQLSVSFTGTDFRASGVVRAQVTCRADLRDVTGLGLPGTKRFTATAVVPIEQYRSVPR